MKNTNKQLTSDEVDEISKNPLPEDREKLLKLCEQVRQNLHSRHAGTPSYKQCHDFLRSIEFRLQWISIKEAYTMNKRMFWIALASSIIALVSVLVFIFK
ncbi:hypothetical protein MYX06_05140 [Patescibacteria group bacterium AH-259-L05]|nr:hypothetical protein [Patescibacteria group bacterium AH-259-L05]